MGTSLLTHDSISDAQLAKYAALVYDRTGIRISPQKKTLLSNRLRRRLRETGIVGYDAYYQHLQSLRPDDAEWDAFLQEITTHETYLFRDEVHWDWFRSQFLAERAALAREQPGQRRLRIWSAACSTGDEATTIACCIAGCLPNFSTWKIRIIGTDIGIGAVEQARAGVYGERAMKLVPEDFKRRFFHKAPQANVWQAKPVLTSMLEFHQHNLVDPFRERDFDLVFLKNVLIYFDPASKRKVLAHVRHGLRPGGLLLSGAAEGVTELVKDMQRIQSWLHRQPQRSQG